MLISDNQWPSREIAPGRRDRKQLAKSSRLTGGSLANLYAVVTKSERPPPDEGGNQHALSIHSACTPYRTECGGHAVRATPTVAVGTAVGCDEAATPRRLGHLMREVISMKLVYRRPCQGAMGALSRAHHVVVPFPQLSREETRTCGRDDLNSLGHFEQVLKVCLWACVCQPRAGR